MIRVTAKPEYPGFDAEVRQPGQAFLATCPQPSSEQFRKKAFWGRAGKELHAAYNGICAYTAMYLMDQGSVDHFQPKATFPELAYEWSNFRLSNGRVNSSKGNNVEVLDPFNIESDWFYMDIPACLIRANPNLDKPLRNSISHTINCLRLNQDDIFVQERCNILIEYARAEISFGFLQRRYPFLAKEVERQNLDQNSLSDLFKL